MSEEESYKSAPLLPIGEKRFLCVEYPGYVKSLKRALGTMGGEKALAQAIQDDSPVELNFRKADIFSHPIKGDILPSTRLLVKVTRHVKRHRETGEIVEEEEGEGWKTEVLGSVTKTLRFRGTKGDAIEWIHRIHMLYFSHGRFPKTCSTRRSFV
jgi:general transcription factor 3C polypeptide 5 (transcription factor C subunit 1)